LNSKRDHIVILSDIVDSCSEGRGITYVMMASGLNYIQAKRYLEYAIDRGFIEVVNASSRRIYRATTKGLKFLRAVKCLRRIINGGLTDFDVNEVSLETINSMEELTEVYSEFRRGKLDLYACILLQTLTPISISTLCNKCFLNRMTCTHAVSTLLRLGLLREVEGGNDRRIRRLYEVTDEGLYFLQNYILAVTLLSS